MDSHGITPRSQRYFNFLDPKWLPSPNQCPTGLPSLILCHMRDMPLLALTSPSPPHHAGPSCGVRVCQCVYVTVCDVTACVCGNAKWEPRAVATGEGGRGVSPWIKWFKSYVLALWRILHQLLIGLITNSPEHIFCSTAVCSDITTYKCLKCQFGSGEFYGSLSSSVMGDLCKVICNARHALTSSTSLLFASTALSGIRSRSSRYTLSSTTSPSLAFHAIWQHSCLTQRQRTSSQLVPSSHFKWLWIFVTQWMLRVSCTRSSSEYDLNIDPPPCPGHLPTNLTATAGPRAMGKKIKYKWKKIKI